MITFSEVKIGAAGIIEDQQNVEKQYLFDKAHILIVDDIPFNQCLLESYLTDYGFTTDLAENGQEALKKINQHKPDLILMDLKMPVLDGKSTVDMIRNNEQMAHIPVILVSAINLTADDQELKKCNAYLKKPVSQPELLSSMARLLPHTLIDTTEECALEESEVTLNEEVASEVASFAELIMQTLKTLTLNDIRHVINTIDNIRVKHECEFLKKWLKVTEENFRFFDMKGVERQLEILIKKIAI